jgi:hypothetical protein
MSDLILTVVVISINLLKTKQTKTSDTSFVAKEKGLGLEQFSHQVLFCYYIVNVKIQGIVSKNISIMTYRKNSFISKLEVFVIYYIILFPLEPILVFTSSKGTDYILNIICNLEDLFKFICSFSIIKIYFTINKLIFCWK